MRPTKVVAAGVAVAIAMVASALASGCARQAAPDLSAEQGGTQETIKMPDYNMAEVEDAGKDLAKLGFKVIVVRPAFTVTASEKSTKPGTVLNVEQYQAEFKEDAWDHWVTIQDPAAGQQVAVGSTVTLTAGEHLGAEPGKEWIVAHGETVKRGDDKECLKSCHKQEHCTDCHDKIGVKDDKAPKSK